MRICVLANGPAQKTKGVRVRELFKDLTIHHEVAFHYRDDQHKWRSTREFFRAVRKASPDIIFVEGVAYAGVLAALAGKLLHGSRIVLSTGDAAYALAKSFMNPVKAQLMGVIEFTALRMADVIIAKGPYHKEILEKRGLKNVLWIPDGVNTSSFKPIDVSGLRGRLGLQDRFTIGVVGSIVLNKKHKFCYGWEIVEVLRLLKDMPVVGVVIGEGDGVSFLKSMAREYGVDDRIVFTGWIDHDSLPEYVNLIDVCISTQSNDLVGQVRTTAKLPEYLACGRYVIASDVGGAKIFVAGSGLLLPYQGVKDARYAQEVARQVRKLCTDHSLLRSGANGVEIAKKYFDYSVLRPALARVIESLQPAQSSRQGTAKSTRICFVVESGTDVRLVEGIAARFDLKVLARRIPGGVAISQSPEQVVDIEAGAASRLRFAWFVLRRLVFGKRFDLVIVQGYALAALAANLVCRLRGAPVFMLVCSPVERYYDCRRVNGTLGKPFRAWEYWGLKVLAWVNARLGRQYIVLSQHLADLVRAHGTHAPIHVVPVYGVDTATFFLAAEPATAIRGRLGLPANGSMIFFSSRIAPEKDSETLLRAFSALLRDGRDVWLLHRSGGYLEFLEDARRFGVIERVIATDARHPRNGLTMDYQASDVCVQASKEEGLGFSPLEALACGVPVVAAAVGGLRETIVDGKTGWTYPVGDSNALARSIADALDHPDEAHRRAAMGRRLVVERYGQDRVFDQLEAVLMRAVAPSEG